MGNRYIIVGNPNTGKTSLFNTLTGARERTANYSGVTVREKSKIINYKGKTFEFVDLPGVYSLSSTSEDEVVTRKYLEKHKDDSIIFVCSSSEIKKNLILLTDLINNNYKIKVIINKMGAKLDGAVLEKINQLLNVPIIQTDVRKRKDEIFDWLSSTIAIKVEESINLTGLLSLFPTDQKTLEKMDAILLHPIFGKIIFFVIFASVLIISYGAIGNGISANLENLLIKESLLVSDLVNSWGVAWLASFWENVVIGGVGSVLIYLPQLALMLTLLFLLEEVGYLPRVASLFNVSLEKLGMNGKSVFSLIMGVGCTTSAMLVTRNIGSRPARLTTAMFLPFVGCSAKLPIIIYISQILLGGYDFLYVILVYLMVFVVGVYYIKITKKSVSESEYFISEIPRIKVPSLTSAVKQSLIIVFDLFKKIVVTIFISATVIWLLLNISTSFKFFSEEESVLEWLAGILSYLFIPLGLNRGDLVIALISGMMAKENIVSTMGLFGSTGNMSVIQAITFLIFIMLYSPCVPALKCAKCELGKNFALKMFASQTLIAYISAFVFNTFAQLSIFLGVLMIIILSILLTLIQYMRVNKTLKQGKILKKSA